MEEQNLGFPSPRETINPKSNEKSRGTEGLRHPNANNPFYELRSPLALNGVLVLQGTNSEPVMSVKFYILRGKSVRANERKSPKCRE